MIAMFWRVLDGTDKKMTRDGAIKIYDIRAKNPVASIAGPYVSGDSIDMYDDMIVTGSSRNKNCMQMFSLS